MQTEGHKLWGMWGQANALYSSWAASRGINYYLLFVLYALDRQESMTQKKICIFTGLTKQTVNSVMKSLKEEGYITLSPGSDDRREKQISLTEKGMAYSDGLLAPLRELEQRVFQIMGSDRVQRMIEDITLFNTVLEKEMEKGM